MIFILVNKYQASEQIGYNKNKTSKKDISENREIISCCPYNPTNYQKQSNPRQKPLDVYIHYQIPVNIRYSRGRKIIQSTPAIVINQILFDPGSTCHPPSMKIMRIPEPIIQIQKRGL